jgi:radical S-adenosyl methionine domain-containing protein 2
VITQRKRGLDPFPEKEISRMNTHVLPLTVNFHFFASCNMNCQFCFACFEECYQLSLLQLKAIIKAIAEAPLPEGQVKPRRINFVGGEPTFYPHLEELIRYARECGLRTSIVTNGYNLVTQGVPQIFSSLDIIGLSIDSLNHRTNLRMGRSVQGKTILPQEWMRLLAQLDQRGVPIKINTTVTKYNLYENFAEFIHEADPLRWKVFQGMCVEGQNDLNRSEWEVGHQAFDRFVSRHRAAGIHPVVESEEVMRGSYAMISPDGRFFDSTQGSHTYSKPILEVGVDRAWNQVCFDVELFNERTVSYLEEVAYV